MDTFFIILRSIKPNLLPILEIMGFFSLTSIVGYTIYSALFKDRKWLMLLPTSALLGIFSFVLFLACLSYFFKGSGGILIILLIFASCGLVLFLKIKPIFPLIRFNKESFFWFLLAGIFLALFFLIAGVNIYGGDVIAYWGFATSFANGNYPVMSPWQPSLLAAHHQGVFLYEGAIYSLIRVNMQLIHSLFSFFIVSSGFFFLWGWMREELKSTFGGLLIAVIFYIAFGTFFIVMPINWQGFFSPEVNHQITVWPRFIDAKNRLGGSSNLNEIYYINHRAAVFAGLFLVLFIMSRNLRMKEKWKLPFLAILSIVLISSDEVVTPAIGMSGLYFLYSLFKNRGINKTKELLVFVLTSLVLAIVLFFVVGSALRDALLIPAQTSRFYLIFNAASLTARLTELKSAILTFPTIPIMLYMPDLLVILTIVAFLAFRIKNHVNNLFLFSIIGTLPAFFFVEHTFYPGNQGRFLHLIYLLTSLSLCFELVTIFCFSKLRYRWLIGVVFTLLFGVGLISATVFLLKEVKSDNYPNYKAAQPEVHPVFSWIQKNASQKRFFFLDGYLKGISYSHYTLTGIQNYGILVPVSPAFIKVHTPDFGVEAFDIIDSLDPDSLKDLKIDYVFVVKGQEFTFSPRRQQEISNSDFFKAVYQDNEGTLYQVMDDFLQNGERKKYRLRDLQQIIPKGSVSFLDEPPTLSIPVRSVALLALQDTGTIYTNRNSGFFNYIEKKLIYQEPQSYLKYDYIFVDPATDPLTRCNCQEVNDFFSIAGLKGYQVIK